MNTKILALMLLFVAMRYGPVLSQTAPKNPVSIFVQALAEQGYSKGDVADIRISSTSFSRHNGATHYYLQQTIEGQDIVKAVANITVTTKQTYINGNAFIKTADYRIQKTKSRMEPEGVVLSVAKQLNIPFAKILKANQSEITTSFTHKPIKLQEVWVVQGKRLIQGLRMEVASNLTADHWQVIVDAATGMIIDQSNYTVYCDFDHNDFNQKGSEIETVREQGKINTKSKSITDGAQYLVYPYPLESPIDGPQTLVVEPSDPEYSPFGWHDTDGIAGPEFTITRGNNAHVFQDTLNENESAGDEPDGGSGLVFDFEHKQQELPFESVDADVTNLFYWNNFIHDWAARLGFDEVSGNFQANNYGQPGRDGDAVQVNSLDGGDTGNANFSTPSDGGRPKMQMYRWIIGSNLEILSPSTIAGEYSTGRASFGPAVPNELIGDLVSVEDVGGVDPLDACDVITNGAQVNGNIALIDRGECFFSEKVFNAQQNGAIACIICNNVPDDGVLTLGGSTNAAQVTIPALSISREDCALVRASLNSSETVTVKLSNDIFELSSGFDNGIVVHEYGHGISMRLTGGPSNSSCLNNDEQLGEGFSDFFGLVLTHQEGDAGEDPRGIGTYVLGQLTAGSGIRRFRYSTDMSVNPVTHGYIRRTSGPHPLGEVIAATLWDLYWAMIEENGYDPTWMDEGSGNFISLRLVMEGLKIQPCDADITEVRDAILRADELNNGGGNKCTIWSVFARRGIGFNATSGDPDVRGDNTDGFETLPACIGDLVITKEVPESYDIGSVMNVVVRVSNQKSTIAESVTITDQIPAGLSLINGSENLSIAVENGVINADVGDIPVGAQRILSYQLRGDDIESGQDQLFENFEGAQKFEKSRSAAGVTDFNITTVDSEGGIFAGRVPGDTITGESFFTLKEPQLIKGPSPRIKFFQRYDLQGGIDGGVIEYSTDGQGLEWTTFEMDDFLLNPYNDLIALDRFYRNTRRAYSGERNDWHEVHIDLSKLVGEQALFRFRYIRSAFNENGLRFGWLIDNFEIVNTEGLQSTVCASDQTGSNVCTDTDVLINSNARIVAVNTIPGEREELTIVPNPAKDGIKVVADFKTSGVAQLRVFDLSGRLVFSEQEEVGAGNFVKNVNVSALQNGAYLIQIVSEGIEQIGNLVIARN